MAERRAGSGAGAGHRRQFHEILSLSPTCQSSIRQSEQGDTKILTKPITGYHGHWPTNPSKQPPAIFPSKCFERTFLNLVMHFPPTHDPDHNTQLLLPIILFWSFVKPFWTKMTEGIIYRILNYTKINITFILAVESCTECNSDFTFWP